MARHPDLPRHTPPAVIRKVELLRSLQLLDRDGAARNRVLAMETDFRKRITAHVSALPLGTATFAAFKTNPFVLLFHALKQGYHHVR